MRPVATNYSLAVLTCLSLLAASGLSCPLTPTPVNLQSGLSADTRAAVRQAISSTALVLVKYTGDAGAPRPRGSAVFVRREGIAVTNFHVIADTRSGKLYDEIVLSLASTSGKEKVHNRYRATAVLIDRTADLALLRVQTDADGNALPKAFTFPTLEIADSESINLLDDLFIIGYPEKGGLTVTVNRGVVEGKDDLSNWIKTDARLIHGNSGGAAVDVEGKLIGVPTKVVTDTQPIDKDGDGFPEKYQQLGAVGFLRPARLVTAMLNRISSDGPDPAPLNTAPTPQIVPAAPSIAVRGVVRAATSKRPVSGALVGLLPIGAQVSAASLLSWGSTNPDGQFKLNNPVPPGRYTLRAKAAGYKIYSAEIEVTPGNSAIVIDL
jgi:S1-C subfamily serine protease